MIVRALHWTDTPERLLADGFAAGHDGLAAWGRGVYLTLDEDSASLQGRGERVALLVEAEIERPLVIEITAATASRQAAIEQALTPLLGEKVQSLRWQSLRERQAQFAPELTRLLQEQGFDAVEVRLAPDVSEEQRRNVGGDQLIVLDPQQARVAGVYAGERLGPSERPRLGGIERPTGGESAEPDEQIAGPSLSSAQRRSGTRRLRLRHRPASRGRGRRGSACSRRRSSGRP